MDPRYQWPPPGYPNAQYGAPPPPNGYPQHGYHPQYQPAPMQMQYGYPQSQPMQGHPQMAIPPPNPQYTPMPSSMPPQPQPQPPRTMHPQVMIPARNPNSIPHMQAQNQRIRQVQVPVPRTGSGVTQGGVMAGQSRPNVPQQQQQQQQQVQSQPMPKPMQQSQSFQENTPRSQQRVSTTPVQNHSQHRSPLQPHSTPQSRPPPQPQTPSTQFRNQSVSGPSSQVKSHPQVVIPKSSSQQSTPQKSPHSQHKMYPQVRPTQTPQYVQKAQTAQPAPSNALPADLAVMLLSAADEYISAARTLGGVATGKPKDVDVRQYYKLMATAMGCMETVLKKFNQAPRDEAKLRLRYASLLIEETENNDEIEKVLTQGIAHCARGRLQDLKYAMTHLQARYQFKSNHRAALKSLDKSIQEAETFQHIVWVYAFRFLKVSLALQAPGRPETSSALQQLHAIASHAERRGDRAIYVTAHALEALAHFRSTTPDRLDNVQRAIAAARSQQLQMSPKQLGSIAALVDIVDIACGLQLGRANPEKINALGDLLDNMDKAKGIEDGVFSVLIERSIGGNLTTDTGGIFRKAEDKRDKLVLSWLPKDGLKLLGNYVGGLDRMYHEKGLVYLKAGIQDALIVPSSSRGSITTSLTQMNWLKVLSWHMTFAFGVIACYRQDYWTARSALSMLKEQIEQPPFSKLPAYTRTLSYLSAVIEQSSGSLSAALSLYSSSIFSLPDGVSTADAQLDLSVLATMNRLLIIRDPNHAEHYLAGPLFAQLDQLCSKHPNETMSVALRLLRALTNPDPSINRQKTMLHITNQAAHQVAQKTDNWQLSIMCLSCITSTFYGDTVGEQPVKGARAVRMVSKRSGSLLWTAVAYGLCISIFEHNGMLQDANACRQAYEEIRDRLPPDLSGEEDLDADGDIDM